jgi:hypothetical protein
MLESNLNLDDNVAAREARLEGTSHNIDYLKEQQEIYEGTSSVLATATSSSLA